MDNSPEKKNTENKLVPFVLTFSSDDGKHFPILNSSRSVKMRSALITLQPGENVGSHNTENYEELLVILDGIGEVQAEGLGKHEVRKDSVVYIPSNNQHDVTNMGSTPLRYIYIVSQTS
jgi:mannose-6-phosphate isomerase-like protein (cupin superfamily)